MSRTMKVERSRLTHLARPDLRNLLLHLKRVFLFNQSTDIKVSYFGHFEFVEIQRDHCETFGDDSVIFLSNLTNKKKTMAQKELDEFSELQMFDVFIIIIRTNMLVQIVFMIQGAHRRCSNQLQI